MKNGKLITEVFAIIGEELSKTKGKLDLSLHIEASKDGVDLIFEFFDQKGMDKIHEMRTSCLNRGIWFDTSFEPGGNINEWNLDWSLEKNLNIN